MKFSFLKYILLFCLSPTLMFADPFAEHEQHERQKEIFESLSKDPIKNIERFETLQEIDNTTKEGNCFDILNIEIKDVTLLKKKDIDKIVKKYLNKCNYLSDLKNLTNELNALYIDMGYITSQVYIIAQNISDGNLTFGGVEGKVGDVLPDEFYTKTAFIGQKEDYLNIRDIEVAIENINRLSSNHATMKLNPSNKTGYTDIIIVNDTSKRVGGSIGVDNYGSDSTGKIQISTRANIDNIFDINDIFNLYYSSSNKHFKDENSIGNGYDYSFPIGRTTFTFSQRNNRFEQFVKAGTSKFLSEGRTKTYTFDTQYKLYHDQNHRANIGASLSNYQTRNYFAETYLDSSSYKLTRVALMADYLYQIPGFYSHISGSYTKGVDLFNNHHSTNLDDGYEYFNLSLSAMKDFYPFRYTLNIYSQFSDDELFGTDRISIGGPYSVRGFNAEGLSGNSGFYARNELSYNLNHEFFRGMQNSFFMALDGGAIKDDDSSFGGELAGYAIGAKFSTKYLEATLQYSIPFYKKDVSKTENSLNFSLRAKF